MDTLSPTVHLIDDDQAVRDSLTLLIGTVGLRVQPWSDPQLFLTQFDRETIGAIVLDVRMPGISGLTVLPPESYGVHLWNQSWRRNFFDKNASYDPQSLVERLKAHYLGRKDAPRA